MSASSEGGGSQSVPSANTGVTLSSYKQRTYLVLKEGLFVALRILKIFQMQLSSSGSIYTSVVNLRGLWTISPYKQDTVKRKISFSTYKERKKCRGTLELLTLSKSEVFHKLKVLLPFKNFLEKKGSLGYKKELKWFPVAWFFLCSSCTNTTFMLICISSNNLQQVTSH